MTAATTQDGVVTYLVKEILFDISFSMGARWKALPDGMCDYINDSIGGSRGLVEQATLWVDEFYGEYMARRAADPDLDTYFEEIDAFIDAKWGQFVAAHMATRITEGA